MEINRQLNYYINQSIIHQLINQSINQLTNIKSKYLTNKEVLHCSKTRRAFENMREMK